MIILEVLALILALIIVLVIKLMPLLYVFLIVSCIVAPFVCIYESRLPNLKMRDKEISIEQVTFRPRNLIKEQYEKRSL